MPLVSGATTQRVRLLNDFFRGIVVLIMLDIECLL